MEAGRLRRCLKGDVKEACRELNGKGRECRGTLAGMSVV